MPILIKKKTFQWLQESLGVLKGNAVPLLESPTLCQVSFDDETYLRNGYLISLVLRKHVEMYGEEYQDLLGVRKLATLKQAENWIILEAHLLRIGCDYLERTEDIGEGEIPISESDISQILEFLMQKYGPKQQKNRLLHEQGKKQYLDYNNFDPNKPLQQAENSLQYICIIIASSFHLTLSQAMGLLIDKSKYLKKLMRIGSSKDQFECVETFVRNMSENWEIVMRRFAGKKDEIFYLLEGVSQGVLSESAKISNLTLELLEKVSLHEWFIKIGYLKLLQSPRNQCFNFVVQKVKPHYELIFNERLHEKVTDKAQLFLLLNNIVKILPKTLYARDILAQLPLTYIYEQIFMVMGSEEMDSQPIEIIVQGRQLLTAAISTFPEKVHSHHLPRIMEIFTYQGSRLYWDQFHLVSQLFQVVKALMEKQNILIAPFFKIIMKYFKNTFGQLRHWIIENLIELYTNNKQAFPLQCFLKMYSTDPISQSDQFNIFDLITQDSLPLSQEEVECSLNIMIYYLQNQLHAKCYIPLIERLLKREGKQAGAWGEGTYHRIIEKIQKMKVPALDEGSNVLNPAPPNKNKVLQSIGIKRKEMLKFRDFQLQKQLLFALTNLNDKKFLHSYGHFVGVSLNRLLNEIGVKKKVLIDLYKKLKAAIKNKSDSILETPSMNQLVQSIIQSRSLLNPVLKNPQQKINNKNNNNKNNLNILSLGESQNSLWQPAQSYFTNTQYHPAIKEEHNDGEEDDNQFLNTEIEERKGDQSRIEENTMLLPFTQDYGKQMQSSPLFFMNPILEQHQIVCIKLAKQKFRRVIQTCVIIYQNAAQANKRKTDQVIKEFLQEIKMDTMISSEDAEELFMKCGLLETNDEQLISNFLVQLAFRVFGFKKNRRIFISCVNSMFLYLRDILKEQIELFTSYEKQEKPIYQNIQFEHKISEAICSSNKQKQSNLIAFSVLSEIFMKSLNIHLMEPLSQQVSEYLSPKKYQKNENNDQHENSDEIMPEEEQEEELEKQTKIPATSRKNNRMKRKKLGQRKLEESIEINTATKSRYVDNKLLKARIEKRKAALEKEMSHKKNIESIVDDPHVG